MNSKYINPYRHLVCGVEEKILQDGVERTHINFDNAATTPPFNCVLEDIMDFAPWYSSIHRGVGYKSQYSSKIFDNSRNVVATFLGISQKDYNIIYVKNTTEALNKLAYRLCSYHKDCVVLSTMMEHHSNDLPWRDKFSLDYINIDDMGRLSLESLEEKLISYDGRVKLVTVTGASNVTGFINPIRKIAKLVHSYGAKLLVDCAQLIPHEKFQMGSPNSSEHIDFVVFSSHKMYSPFGIGVLVVPRNLLCSGNPEQKGGGTVQLVTEDYALWHNPPDKEEAGTPNIMGVVALVSAIEMLQSIGMDVLSKYEMDLFNYLVEKLTDLPDIETYSYPLEDIPRVSILPFNIKGIPHNTLAKILADDWGISVRSGCFCAQPYMQKILGVTAEEIYSFTKKNELPPHGVVRISLGLYNTYSEIDFLIKALRYIISHKDAYLQKHLSEPILMTHPLVYDTN